MKKYYLAAALLCSGFWVESQDLSFLSSKNQKVRQSPTDLSNVSHKKDVQSSSRLNTVSYGTVIGQTSFDLQSNYGNGGSRILHYDDGTITSVWMQSLDLNGGNPDRGTGYNIWSPISLNWDTGETNWYGLNTTRTGWPQLVQIEEGEYVMQHTFNASDLVINQRDTIGIGSWGLSQSFGFNAVWPRTTSIGDTIHLIAIDNQTNPINGINNPLKYYRSDDGGQNWGISDYYNFPDYNANTFWFNEISGDAYAIDAYKNYVAFVVGGGWDPLVLYKSDNYGEDGSWTKTVIYTPDSSHAFADPLSNILIVPGLSSELSIVIDKTGQANISTTGFAMGWDSGQAKPQNSNAVRFYYPLSSLGIYYWNESMGTQDHIFNKFVTLDPGTGNVLSPITHFFDYTGEGDYNIPDDAMDVGTYNSGVAGHSSISLDQDSGIFIVWSQVAETSEELLPTTYRDIFFVYSFDEGGNWSNAVNVAGLEISDDGFSEGSLAEEDVFPSTIKRVGSDNLLHMTFQTDFQTGMHVQGDLHPIALSDIVYYPIDIDYFRNLTASSKPLASNKVMGVYPNPSNGMVTLNFNSNTELNISNISVLNLIGKELYRNDKPMIQSNTFDLDLRGFDRGIYLIKIHAEGKDITKKIMLN